MKAIHFTARERAELVDIPDATGALAADEVEGPTLTSLVSPGTELAIWRQERSSSCRTGYAATFIIERVGSDVRDLRPGMVVFAMGSHASWQRHAGRSVVPVPDGLEPKCAVFARLAAVGWSTLTTTPARPPNRVLITGLGPVGNLAAQLFASCGYRVTAIDPVASRRQIAESCGLVDIRAELTRESSSAEYQLALECSGHEGAALQCCNAVRKGGEVSLVGAPWVRRVDLQAHELLHAIFHRYVTVRSGWEWQVPRAPTDFAVGSIAGQLGGALDFLAAGRIHSAGLADTRDPLDATDVYAGLAEQRTASLSSIFIWR